MNQQTKQVIDSAKNLVKQLKGEIDYGIILGSGLGNIAEQISIEQRIPYSEIPGLPLATAPSHQGQIIIGTHAGKTLALCMGRFHLYEGYSASQVASLVYFLNALGCQRLLVTNAAGALNSDYRPGDIMVIHDHINFTGSNPLVDSSTPLQDDALANRFTDMSNAYDSKLAANALRIGSDLGLAIHTGVYAGVLGPSLETSAERRMLAQWGADAVGMSTVMEVIAAKHCAMQVLGLSAITNLALGDENQQADTIEAVLENAAKADQGITEIIKQIVEYSN